MNDNRLKTFSNWCTDLVASSSISIDGFFKMALAIAILCF